MKDGRAARPDVNLRVDDQHVSILSSRNGAQYSGIDFPPMGVSFTRTVRRRAFVPDPASVPLFKRLLGASYERLPAPIRQVHDGREHKVLSGRCCIRRGSGVLASLLGWLT